MTPRIDLTAIFSSKRSRGHTYVPLYPEVICVTLLAIRFAQRLSEFTVRQHRQTNDTVPYALVYNNGGPPAQLATIFSAPLEPESDRSDISHRNYAAASNFLIAAKVALNAVFRTRATVYPDGRLLRLLLFILRVLSTREAPTIAGYCYVHLCSNIVSSPQNIMCALLCIFDIILRIIYVH